jgi:hypothetical protein
MTLHVDLNQKNSSRSWENDEFTSQTYFTDFDSVRAIKIEIRSQSGIYNIAEVEH